MSPPKNPSKDSPKVRIVLGPWSELAPLARPVRTQVFVLEQNVPQELEWDDMDAVSLHALALASATAGPDGAVATGRLLPDGHVGRMAVMPGWRGWGVGGAILEALLQAARERAMSEAVLHAQVRAQAFYARHGFVAEGPRFMEAGIEHVRMRLGLRLG